MFLTAAYAFVYAYTYAFAYAVSTFQNFGALTIRQNASDRLKKLCTIDINCDRDTKQKMSLSIWSPP